MSENLAKGSPFLDLPGELRELIYTNVFRSIYNKYDAGEGYDQYRYDLSLMRVNQQIYYEARTIFRKNNIFISIETPWPEAQQHIRDQGYVPILITDEQASRFKNQHLAVSIHAPRYQNFQPLRKFIILQDDLRKFTAMWYYSDLSHPGLNSNLRLTLKLQDPYAASFEARPVPKASQLKLLEPFGEVKGLFDVEFDGEIYSSVKKMVKDLMAVPYKSVEECLDEGNKLKEKGNEALGKKEYKEAVKLYEQSFLAIHIVCNGRQRSIWGDAYFDKQIHTGTFKGENAQQVRLVLRIRLVANIIHAYLQLGDYEEARFWGKRSIDMMPYVLQAAGEDDLASAGLDNFIAFPEIGKIFFRTAIASKVLGDDTEARAFLKVATKLLPNDLKVRAEYNAMALRMI